MLIAVAVAPPVPPEPLRATASFSIAPVEEVRAPVLTKVDAFEANTRATLNEYKSVFNIKDGEEENLVHLMTAIGQAESDLKSDAVNGKDKGIMQIRIAAAQDVITRLGPEKAKEFLKKYGIDRSEIKEEDLGNHALSEEVAKLYVLICREDIHKLGINDETIVDGLTAFLYNAGRKDGINMILNTEYYKGKVTAQGVVQMAKTNAEKIWDKYHITREKN